MIPLVLGGDHSVAAGTVAASPNFIAPKPEDWIDLD